MSARVDVEVKRHLEAMHRALVAAGDLECGDLSPPFPTATCRGVSGDKSPDEKAVTSHRTPNRVLPFDADLDGEEILQPRRLSLRVF